MSDYEHKGLARSMRDDNLDELLANLKFNNRIEKIFAHAVALEQSGRLHSNIYCYQKYIYIVNQNDTIIMRFPLLSSEPAFDKPLGFNAKDFQGQQINYNEKTTTFVDEDADFVKEKSCATLKINPEEVHQVFENQLKKENFENKITITTAWLKYFDDSLGHLEFRGRDNQLIIKQRDLYSGTVIAVSKKNKGGLGLDNLKVNDFDTFGIRTLDFMALFSFVEEIQLSFGQNVMMAESIRNIPFKTVISRCIYDELVSEE